MKFNEDTRVKIPTIIHLTRLGYNYLSLKSNLKRDEETNIFTDILKQSLADINEGIEEGEIDNLIEDVKLSLDNEDLGKAFYRMLVERSGIKLIDFNDFSRNQFHVVTELTYKNGDEEFRPDITLLINGMPLIFIEVKKPNNREGVLAERDRINKRFTNPKFRRFANITQLTIFSNNMEYDDRDPEPIQGAFYATSSYKKPVFNYFREEEEQNLSLLLALEDDDLENVILKDTNLQSIKTSAEFITNKDPNKPTNRICTSLLSKDRLGFLLEYAIAYVKESSGIQKHIMRYPQIFATKAIAIKLSEGIRKGIIWHTQGSGKTALAYYNVKFLKDYFSQQGIVPKFYFIVDRLDLLEQAKDEFTKRGLIVHSISSRDDFAKDIKSKEIVRNNLGELEITVVNIQKFKDDPDVIVTDDYDLKLQRVYFLDEVHRSYNPKGSFLANLQQSDRNAIKIGLTGTPLLGDNFNSRALFGDYIHKYYYNASIADGYTLRLIREAIATNYQMALKQAVAEIEIQQGDLNKKLVYAHPRFVEPMLDYIVEDFESSRNLWQDGSIGGMVICDSSEQAKKMWEIFKVKYESKPVTEDLSGKVVSYDAKLKQRCKVKSAALILHDIGTKEERKQKVQDFKYGKIDFLFVYNMLLTGFDARRLKKLYLGRTIRKHNLLQALTRVNRTYKEFRYGYIVDFADIRREFDATNKAYFEELQSELGDELEHYDLLFKSQEEISEEIETLKDILFRFDIDNAEIFSQQINEIQDRKQILEIKQALGNARELYNLIRTSGQYELLTQIDFQKLNLLYRETSNRLDLLNLKVNIENSNDSSNLLNSALEDVVFLFTKVDEEELVLADELKNTLRKTREALASNSDQKDPEFVKLREELERLFRLKKLGEVEQAKMIENIGNLNKIHDRIKELNRQNRQLQAKYQGDVKFARIHKRILEKEGSALSERKTFEALSNVKAQADDKVLQNSQMLDNESFFSRLIMQIAIAEIKKNQNIDFNIETVRYINNLIVQEYLKEFNNEDLGV